MDLLFTDLGLHDDLQAGLMLAQAAVKRTPDLPVLHTTDQGVTDGMRAMFVERNGFIAKPYADNPGTTVRVPIRISGRPLKKPRAEAGLRS